MKSLLFTILLAGIFMLEGSCLTGQQIALAGKVSDGATGAPIAYANVTAGLAASDSYRIESFAVTDEDGRFRLLFRASEPYVLRVSFLGYQTLTDTIDPGDIPVDYVLQLLPASNDLSTVEVTYKLPIKVSGDTISYAADAFTDGNERKLEDILKKLPGFAVSENGEISVNGKRVKDLKVDGKDFFGGNTKLAARSLPADAVDRVDVLRNYSNDDRMGDFADGDGTALNIRLRADKKNLLFGDVYAGYGAEGAHDGGANLFYFGPATSVNLLANRNDIGRQVLTYQDMFRFNGGFARDRSEGALAFAPSQLGLGTDPELSTRRTDELAALSLSHQPNDNFKASGTLLYGGGHLEHLEQTIRSVLGREEQTATTLANTRQGNTKSLTGLLRADYNFTDRLNIAYRMMASDGTTENNGLTRTQGHTISSDLLQDREQYRPAVQQQVRMNYSPSDRTLWVFRLDQQLQRADDTYRLASEDLPFGFGDSTVGTRQLRQARTNDQSVYGTRLEYFRSLNGTNQLNLYAGWMENASSFTASLVDGEDNTAEGFSAGDDVFRVRTPFLGLGHRLKRNKWTISSGLRSEFSFWRERTGTGLLSGRRTFLLPYSEVAYDIRKSSSLSLSYRQSIKWPGAEHRTPALIIRDLFTIGSGTSDLRESREHQLSASYYNYNLFNQVTYIGGVTASVTRRPLTQRVQLRGQEQATVPTASLGSNTAVTAYLKVDKYAEHFKLAASLDGAGFTNELVVADVPQRNRSLVTSFDASVRSRLEKWPNLLLAGKIVYGSYQAGHRPAREFLTLTPRIRCYGELFPRLRFSTEYQYRGYRQLAGNTSNVFARWNASLRYETANHRFQFEFSGLNLLNRRAFVSENFSDFLFVLRTRETLGRRLLAKVIYVL